MAKIPPTFTQSNQCISLLGLSTRNEVLPECRSFRGQWWVLSKKRKDEETNKAETTWYSHI